MLTLDLCTTLTIALCRARGKNTDVVIRRACMQSGRCLEGQLHEVQKALAARDHELLAAREDLEHDEVIFAGRMRDLQGLQSQLQDLQVCMQVVPATQSYSYNTQSQQTAGAS